MQVLGAHELFIVENIHHNPELQWDEKCDLDLPSLLQCKDELTCLSRPILGDVRALLLVR